MVVSVDGSWNMLSGEGLQFTVGVKSVLLAVCWQIGRYILNRV